MRLSTFEQLARSAALIAIVACTVAGGAPRSVNVPDRVFDEYGRIRWGDEQARLDNFAITLQQDPKLVGYVTVYAGRVSFAGEAQRHALKIKNYLVQRRQIEATRILWLDAGYIDSFRVVLQPADRDAKIILPIYPCLLARDVHVAKCKTVRYGKRA